MSNRITIEQLRQTPLSATRAIPLDQLQMLIDDCDDAEKMVKADKALIKSVLDHRFGDDARRLRMEAGKDTGTVSIKCGDFVVRSELGKKVDWDQDALGGVACQLETMGENPFEFLKVEYKVSEKSYDAWPKRYRSLFEPARTVSPGASKYKIEARKGGR